MMSVCWDHAIADTAPHQTLSDLSCDSCATRTRFERVFGRDLVFLSLMTARVWLVRAHVFYYYFLLLFLSLQSPIPLLTVPSYKEVPWRALETASRKEGRVRNDAPGLQCVGSDALGGGLDSACPKKIPNAPGTDVVA